MQCESCRFFAPDLIQNKLNHSKGWCRCGPPVLLDRMVEKHTREGLSGLELAVKCSAWPGVDKTDFCGKYIEKGGDERGKE